MKASGTVVVWGLLASMPFPGMMWHRLQYLTGLRRLGFDVWYVEDSDRTLMHPVTLDKTVEPEANIEYLARHMERIGMQDRWVFRIPGRGEECVGARDYAGLLQLYRDADFVINHCGAQELLPHHSEIRYLVYLETDPVANQVAAASGDERAIKSLSSYDALLTFGANIGSPDCLVPTAGFEWIPTVPAICVDWWATERQPAEPLTLTTIMTWKHTGKDVEWQGQRWSWSKHEEFAKVLDLPAKSPLRLELAVGGIKRDDLEMLERHGWNTVPARSLDSIDTYRNYIWDAAGELTIAKAQVVVSRSGWFSDRSATFLASGRPVITQDTGFGNSLPVGRGLFAFSTGDEALAAIEAVASDYEGHARAAREIAAEYFDAERVIARSLTAAGLL